MEVVETSIIVTAEHHEIISDGGGAVTRSCFGLFPAGGEGAFEGQGVTLEDLEIIEAISILPPEQVDLPVDPRGRMAFSFEGRPLDCLPG